MTDKIKGGLADNMTLEQIAEKHGVTLSAIESALADGIAVEMEHTDDKATATEIAKDHLFEDAEYYSKLKTIEKTNSKDWAKTYKASNFIEKGVCTYNDETIYLSQECLNKAIASIKGRPVVIKHQKVTPQNMEDHAVGYVSGCGFSEWDASFYCDFLIFDDEGKEVIAKDYSVSCAYIPKAFGKGGTWHNTPYDREVTELEFTHLALVPDPRYEDAKIYENAMDEEGDWITVKGSHIFIPKGQDKDKVIGNFFEKAKKGKETQKVEYGELIDKSHFKFKEDKESGGYARKIHKTYAEAQKSYSFKLESQKKAEEANWKRLGKSGIPLRDAPEIVENPVGDGFIVATIGLTKKYGLIKAEKQNSTDNTTKETYNMENEKVEVPTALLDKLFGFIQQPFLNAKEEPKDKEDAKVDDDEMEYEGKKYSKKELVNAFEAGCAGKKAEEEKEEEKENSKDSDEDMEFFNSMQKLMAEANTDADDKIVVHSQNKGLELGSKAFG